MSDFEGKKYDEFGNPLPEDNEEENKVAEDGENKPEMSNDQREEMSEENKEEKSTEDNREENERRYGYYSSETNRGYGDSYGYHEVKPKKKKSGVFLSNKGLVALVCFCLVFSVLIGICTNAISNRVSDIGNNPTESNETTVTNAQTGETEQTVKTPEQTTLPSTVQKISDYTSVPMAVFSADDGRELSNKEICAKCVDSVVIIEVTTASSGGAGSGVIYSKDGYIITNYHVANPECKTISVKLNNGETYAAAYVYGDEQSDIAVIKIDKDDCKAVSIGDSSKVVMGDPVIAIGNPLGYGIAATEGMISAVERTVTIDNTTMILLQTSAAINQGNSGGGLFNSYGQLIGIVNAKVGGTLVEGTGYAIPTSSVLKSVNDLKEYGYVTGKARLGVSIDTSTVYSQYLIRVMEVNENGSAYTAGIKVNDILYTFDGESISSFAVLTEKLTKYKVGDTVALTILRPKDDISNYIKTGFFGTEFDIMAYIRSCEEITVAITFTEFNPNN